MRFPRRRDAGHFVHQNVTVLSVHKIAPIPKRHPVRMSGHPGRVRWVWPWILEVQKPNRRQDRTTRRKTWKTIKNCMQTLPRAVRPNISNNPDLPPASSARNTIQKRHGLIPPNNPLNRTHHDQGQAHHTQSHAVVPACPSYPYGTGPQPWRGQSRPPTGAPAPARVRARVRVSDQISRIRPHRRPESRSSRRS